MGGEVKQKEWLKSVHETSNSTSDPKVRGLLKKLSAYSNIPRKKKKFENFCKNSVNVYDSKTLDQLWELFTGGTTTTTTATTTTCNGDDNNTDSDGTVNKESVPDILSSNSTTQHNGENSDSDAEPPPPKKKKKKKKEEQQQVE